MDVEVMIIWYTHEQSNRHSAFYKFVHLVSVLWTDSLIKLHISSSQFSVFIRQKAERNHADILADIYFEIQPCAWRSKQHFNHRCVVYTCLTCLYCQTPASCYRNWKYIGLPLNKYCHNTLLLRQQVLYLGTNHSCLLWKWEIDWENKRRNAITSLLLCLLILDNG